MIKSLWHRFGTHVMFVGLVGLIFLGAALLSGYGKLWFPPRVPSSATLDMTRIITYERALKTDVLFVEFDESGTEWVWVIWNDDWIEDDRPFRLAKANAPMVIMVLEPRKGIIESGAGIEYADIYYVVWHLEFIEDFSSTFIGVPLERPDAVEWDWGQH